MTARTVACHGVVLRSRLGLARDGWWGRGARRVHLPGQRERGCWGRLTCRVYICVRPQRVFGPMVQDDVLATISEWLADSACNRNPTVLLIAGMIYAYEGNYVEALKTCHTGLSLEMCVPGGRGPGWAGVTGSCGARCCAARWVDGLPPFMHGRMPRAGSCAADVWWWPDTWSALGPCAALPARDVAGRCLPGAGWLCACRCTLRWTGPTRQSSRSR